ncbi:MAG: cytochrome C [Planctomycetaceae bacterium]|nr:MAG: cytochrome C [Planctomycetaceae bacterium]
MREGNEKRVMTFFAHAVRIWLISGCAICFVWGSAAFSAEPTASSIDLADFPGAAEPGIPPAAFGEMVRDTVWRAPERQREAFHVPPGFEVRLFASEPQIAKPLNLAIDPRGRVWMTQTTAYPYQAPDGVSDTDAVVILEDTDGDGQADSVTTFARGLNIPIGILPYGDGCIVFSIPNLLYLRDLNGDGVCDSREVLYGPFDTTRDTHGMVNALRDGGDGWIYACHGFNNRSVVAGKDGHEVRLESGNTFRFRPDGSRIEQYTQGQVNPFGMTRDEWGYWYTADCHSKPITQLIRGASYPSFGRPHDGLGFLPPTIDHLHGSTAISGIVYIPDDSPLVPLRGQLLSGNVMTSRINRDLLTYRGATARGIELPDFLTTDDPWFRPVDLQLDREGNLYIADFYNKIIGHYEVPLDHPGRDRTSGRVWQVRYVGDSGDAARGPNAESTDDAVSAGDTAVDKPLADRVAAGDPRDRVMALREVANLSFDSGDSELLLAKLLPVVLAALDDDHAHVARAAAEAIGQLPTGDEDTVRLARRLMRVDDDDPVLRQSIRIAIRDRLRRVTADSSVWESLLGADVAADQASQAASILLGIADARVVPPLVRYLRQNPDAELRKDLTRHAATHAGEDSLADVVGLARELTADSPGEQIEMLEALLAARSRAGVGESDPLRPWALEIADRSLAEFREQLDAEQHLVGWTTGDGEAWQREPRPLVGAGVGNLRSSFTRGERYVGKSVSDPFPAPPSIRFRVAGHGGPPDRPDHEKNWVRLVRVSDNQVLRHQLPPRQDAAVLVTWELDEFAGQSVRIECQDGDSGNAYAWIAIGHFEPTWIDLPATSDALTTALRLYRQFGLREREEALSRLVAEPRASVSLRLEIATAVAGGRGDRDWEALLEGCRAVSQYAELAEQVLTRFLEPPPVDTTSDEPSDEPSDDPGDEPDDGDDPLTEAIRLVTSHLDSNQEIGFVRTWVRRGGSPQRLLELCERGWVSPGVLSDAAIVDALVPRLSAADRERLGELTANLSTQSAVDLEAVGRLTAASAAIEGDPIAGGVVFTRHCAACHQLRGVGTLIGPQLDGVVTRSHARLIEDLLIPDQNVDAAFRTTSLLLEDGRVLVGMVQTEDETEVRIADVAGKTIVVPVAEIESRVPSPRSLMPGNFIEVLSAEDIAHLIRYIRSP